MTEEERRAIEQDCARLVIAYHVYVDNYDHEKVLSLFAEHAVVDHAVVGMIRGKAALAAYFDAKDTSTVAQHVMTNVLIDVIDDDHARGTAYWTAYISPAAALPAPMSGPAALGSYQDTFIRTPAGWKFHTRRVIGRFAASDRGSTTLLKGGAAAVEKVREKLGG
ncbi:nuclear transport factor 2 family protein [Phenylobacterium sp.]|uniref:nuclear transport factor 2 family protein n=1 Tax=Phenylobacterium sp. TaxID=1871053 RepID=UPI002F3EA04A